MGGMNVAWAPRLTRVWIPLLLVAAVAWLATLYLAAGMDGMSPAAMGPAFFGFGWLLMMAAMMLPSVAPVAQAWLGMVSRQETDVLRRTARTAALVIGYLVAWAVVGVPAYGLAVGLDRLSMGTPPVARLTAAAILISAGSYQFTPLKRACLRHCRTPIASLLHYAAVTGPLRDIRVGLRHGAYCVGCCWGLMAALVLLGAMNLFLMALLAGVVFGEKVWRHGPWLGRAVGVALGLLGLAALVGAAG